MTDSRSDGLTHLRKDGSAQMVDVSDKAVTKRTARAEAYVMSRPEVIQAIIEGNLPKGEALSTARIAGIMAAKRTPDLIPLCHPLALTRVEIDFDGADDRIRIIASVTTTGVTGVEMEALTAASVAALTLYDMVKAIDRHTEISQIRVIEKSGGKSGNWSVPDRPPSGLPQAPDEVSQRT